MKKLVLFGAAVVLAACAMPQGTAKNTSNGGFFGQMSAVQPDQFVDEVVEVITEPAGARVQINGGLIGFSPAKATVRRYWRGQPGDMTLDAVTVEALAAAPGQCDQSGIYGEGSRKVPSPVRLSMTACSAAQTKPAGKK